MDPPEELSRNSGSNGEKQRGVDPNEQDHYMEPEAGNDNGDDNDDAEEEDNLLAKLVKSAADAKSKSEMMRFRMSLPSNPPRALPAARRTN